MYSYAIYSKKYIKDTEFTENFYNTIGVELKVK